MSIATSKYNQISRKGLSLVMDQINRSLYSASFSEGLNPAQWGALRFLSLSAPSKRTVSGFADFQDSTAGTASRTLASLEKKGLAIKERSPDDHRSYRVNLTPEGWDTLERDPLRLLEEALEHVPEDQLDQLAGGLEIVLRSIKTQP